MQRLSFFNQQTSFTTPRSDRASAAIEKPTWTTLREALAEFGLNAEEWSHLTGSESPLLVNKLASGHSANALNKTSKEVARFTPAAFHSPIFSLPKEVLYSVSMNLMDLTMLNSEKRIQLVMFLNAVMEKKRESEMSFSYSSSTQSLASRFRGVTAEPDALIASASAPVGGFQFGDDSLKPSASEPGRAFPMDTHTDSAPTLDTSTETTFRDFPIAANPFTNLSAIQAEEARRAAIVAQWQLPPPSLADSCSRFFPDFADIRNAQEFERIKQLLSPLTVQQEGEVEENLLGKGLSMLQK